MKHFYSERVVVAMARRRRWKRFRWWLFLSGAILAVGAAFWRAIG